MSQFDRLVEMALVKGELENGTPARIVVSRSPQMAARNGHVQCADGGKSPAWSEAQDEFLRENLGSMSEKEMARRLGRTVVAVHLRWKRDLALPAPTKDPRYLTARGVARALGLDDHRPAGWVRSGILTGERLPSPRILYQVRKEVVVEFATDPLNWIYFDPDSVSDPLLRRLIERRKTEWGDDWWTTNRVAEYHGVENKDVVRLIKQGKIRATHVPNLSGRHDDPRWAYWFVLRSEATREDLKFVKLGKGRYPR